MPRPCPHCAADNPHAGAFCSFCGRSMAPAQPPAQPAAHSTIKSAPPSQGVPLRPLALAELPTQDMTAYADQALLARHMKWAVTVPATLAVLSMLAAGVIIAIGFASSADDFERRDAAIMLGAILGGQGMLYFGISLWAKRDPLPAAMAGLGLYIALMAIDVAIEPSAIWRGIIIKILIITMLAKAIDAASKHRALSQRLATQPPAPVQTPGQFRKVA